MVKQKRNLWLCLLLPCIAALVVGCGVETFSNEYRTVVAPVAKTLVERGGNVAETQAAKLLQTGQVKIATESANLRETAKVEAATAAGALIDTAQAELVTQSAGQVTAAPTQVSELNATVQSFAATQAAHGIPYVATQAMRMLGTIVPGLPTEAPGEAQAQSLPTEQAQQAVPSQEFSVPAPQATPTINWYATLQSLSTPPAQPRQNQSPPLTSTPIPARTLIIYTVQVGDTIEQVAAQFGLQADYLAWLNQLRYPWLVNPPHVLLPGSTLVVSRLPDDPFHPLYPVPEPHWSSRPGCNVQQVDWLQSPIECIPAVIDIVISVQNSFSCITLKNPLGAMTTHQVVNGWLLRGAEGASSYGWFIDRLKNSIVVGPAIVSGKSSYQMCEKPEK